jgi:2-polyprenyl-3-methyl-5-hydroxy-6-metoxy-1,4-benzoquinol methylase
MQTQIKNHWEHIYNTKQPNQVSWTQEMPSISINFVKQFQIPKDAAIIDVGGGDSKFVDYLLAEGYTNVSVLDISEAAINRAKARLGDKALNVNWIVSDILAFNPALQYDLWHDRAAFHFQTENSSFYSHTPRQIYKIGLSIIL